MTAVAATRRSPHPSVEALARAIGYGLLAAERWERRSLIAAASDVLGARRRWVPGLVDEVLAFYHRAPVDSPRELAVVVARTVAFSDAVERAAERRMPIPIRHYPVTPASARPGSLPLPRLDTLADLAALLGLDIGELEWFADARGWNRRAPERLQHYRHEWRTRPGRAPRLLEVPEQRMRRAQRTLLDTVIGVLPAHDAAHGFMPGRGVISGAEAHLGSAVVIALDLVSFFSRVPAKQIYAVLRRAGLPEAVAHRVTALCTHAVPPAVLAGMPPGGSPEERFALRQALARPHLPQGAPSSPMLANLAVRRLDARLSGWADAADARYTRYADDLSFSGGAELSRRSDAFVRGVARIVAAEGHELNERKTRVRRPGERQSVTGVVVNDRLNLARRDLDQLKAILHNCAVHGPESQNRAGHADFRAHVQGRLNWVESLNPERAARLRRDFERIVW